MQHKSVLLSIGHAVDGLVHCLRTQKHMRLHFFLAFGVVGAAALLQVHNEQLLALLFSVTLVLVAEMLNTGIEIAVDMIKPTYDPRAKVIKDVAAGAVLLSSLSAALIGLLVFLRSPVVTSFRERTPFPRYSSTWPELSVEALVILMIVVVASKAKGSQGSVLLGGPISGKAAFGFFASALIILPSSPEIRIAAACLLALLVVVGREGSYSYKPRQVVLGAVLGIIVPGVVFAVHFVLPWSG